MMSTTNLISCSVCHKTYSRPDLLQRHLKAHASTFTHRCTKCGKHFNRSDVLKRHSASCSSTSSKGPKIQRNRACRHCATHKRRCDYARPCRNCVKSNASCIYRIDPHEGVPSSSGSAKSLVQCDGTFDSLRFDTCLLLPVLGFDADPARSFPFLTEFTKDLSLPHSFEGGTAVVWSAFTTHEPYSRSSVDVNLHEWPFLPLGHLPIAGQYAETTTPFNAPYFPIDAPFIEGNSVTLQFETTIYSNGVDNWKDDPLAIKSFDIIQAIGLSIQSLNHTNVDFCDTHSSMHTSLNNFFSPPQLRKFLDLYWIRWYPNWPTIHKPLFDPLQTPDLLLAAMAIIGACHSPDLQDCEASKFWAEVVEELVFNELEMIKDEIYSSGRRHVVKLLQAVCLVVFYQNWNGSATSKKRMRRQRFGTLVGACRDAGIFRAVHEDYRCASLAAFDWRTFIETEETIRTSIFAFLIDSAYVLFHNSPPRIALAELKMDLALPERCFQASTADECFLGIQWWLCKTQRNQPHRYSSLFDFVGMFCRDELDLLTVDICGHEAYMNYFAITCALHVIVFNMTNVIFDNIEERLLPIKRGLENWRKVWNRRLSIERSNAGAITSFDISIEPGSEAHDHQQGIDGLMVQEAHSFHNNDWRRPGFWRHASENWLLCHRFVERLESAQKRLEPAETLSGLEKPRPRIESKILRQYDESTMEELHKFLLICDGG